MLLRESNFQKFFHSSADVAVSYTHLDVYKRQEYLTAENEELTAQIAESRADIQILKDDKEQAIREKQEAEQRAEDAEKEVKSLDCLLYTSRCV